MAYAMRLDVKVPISWQFIRLRRLDGSLCGPSNDLGGRLVQHIVRRIYGKAEVARHRCQSSDLLMPSDTAHRESLLGLRETNESKSK